MDGESAQKRQQSALELLLTYSWAFIIIAVFIAVVFLLAGSKPPAQYLPSQCNIQPLLPCVQTLITTPGTTTKASYKLLLINNLGPAINFTKNGFSINTTGVGALGNSQYIGNCTPSLLLEGSEALCNVYMTGNYFPAVGSQTSVEFTIGYQICNGQTQSSCPSTVYKSSGYSIQSMSSPSSNLYKLTFATSSEGTIVLNGHSYSGGTSVLLPLGKYSVYANPSAGYAFTSWSTTSGVTVVSSTSQSTNATLSANSTLTASFIYVGASTSTTSTATTSTSTTVTTTTATTSTSTTVTSTTSTSSTSTTSTTSSTTTTILNGVLYYVPVTITNGRSAATPSTFQERIAVPSSTYSSYIDSNWDNVEFTTGPSATGSTLDAWVESNATNAATATIVWVQLTSSIPANSNTVIYMNFMSSPVMSSSGPTGEAPQLSGTYGQYDDGAQVFTVYTGFEGTSLSPAWTENVQGSSTITINNGALFQAVSGKPAYLFTVSAYAYPQVMEANIASESGSSTELSVGESATLGVLSGAQWPTSSYGLDFSMPSTLQLGYRGSSGSKGDIGSVSSSFQVGIWNFTWPSTGNEILVDPNAGLTETDTTNPIANNYGFIGLVGGGSGNFLVQWARMRAYPPNGIMPSASFGSPVHYVQITLTDSESYATNPTWQMLITVPSSTYSNYIDSNWDNVEFTDGPADTGNVLDAWVQDNPSNTASATDVWIKLQKQLNANSNMIIYMNFMPSPVMSSSGPTGEAPQLSGTYGQYDDGYNVFQLYDNFKSSLNTGKWQVFNSAGGSYSVSDGLILTTASTNDYIWLVTNKKFTENLFITTDFTSQSGNTLYDIGFTDANTAVSAAKYMPFNSYDERWYSGDEKIGVDTNGVHTTVDSGVYPFVTGLWNFTWATQSTGEFQYGTEGNDPYMFVQDTTVPLANYYGFLGMEYQATTAGSDTVQWVAFWMALTDADMPTFSFGSVQ